MDQTPASPSEFLESAREVLRREYHHEMLMIKEGAQAPPPRSDEVVRYLEDHFNRRVSDLFTAICRSLPVELQLMVHVQVAAGAILRSSGNAWIRKGDAFCYGIIVNSGLMELIAKYFRYHFAAEDPSIVVAVDGNHNPRYSQSDYRGFQTAVTAEYLKRHMPLGPALELRPDHNLAQLAACYMNLADTFILAHELAHYLNGDMKRAAHRVLSNDPEVDLCARALSRQQEYDADFTGFNITAKTFQEVHGLSIGNDFFRALRMLFEILEKIEDRDTLGASHPTATDRLQSLIERIEREYGDGDSADPANSASERGNS